MLKFNTCAPPECLVATKPPQQEVEIPMPWAARLAGAGGYAPSYGMGDGGHWRRADGV